MHGGFGAGSRGDQSPRVLQRRKHHRLLGDARIPGALHIQGRVGGPFHREAGASRPGDSPVGGLRLQQPGRLRALLHGVRVALACGGHRIGMRGVVLQVRERPDVLREARQGTGVLRERGQGGPGLPVELANTRSSESPFRGPSRRIRGRGEGSGPGPGRP